MNKYITSPVHIRQKKLPGGKISLILDICMDGQRVKESFGLYLLPEQTRADKQANENTLLIADEIRARKIVEIREGKFSLQDREAGRTVLAEWLEQQRKYYHDHGNMNYSKTIHNLIRHLTVFSPNLQLKCLTPSFLRKFLDYLSSDGANKYAGKLSPDTVYTYFTVLSILMNKAVRLNMIVSNPFHKLSLAETVNL